MLLAEVALHSIAGPADVGLLVGADRLGGWVFRVLPRGSTDGYPTRVFWVGWLSSTPTVFGWHPDTQTRDVGSGYSAPRANQRAEILA
jgi:hypothetical protein